MAVYFESLEFELLAPNAKIQILTPKRQKFEVFEDVYPPSEESFLLAKYARKLKGKILEIGCGCGFLSVINAQENRENEVIGVDVNEEAVRNAKENAKRNGVKNCVFVEGNLFRGINGKFDWIISNPPYLPTAKNEKLHGKINLAFDGGKDGRKVIDRLVQEAGEHLKEEGGLLLLDSSLDDTNKTVKMLKEEGFAVEVLEKERHFFEELSVLKAVKVL
ncbi:methyltransferase [Candidatus Micrarchaeota archaeon CG11_big_fil_rev_8_21_14_0_20_47_5]|nr:MAG: hypothetical protein AUJ17_05625 [Candidatus Micrarchaeota archaeon CG1_02_47_40]PIN84113.1 MAG: methyltransferase [Candidatus Micrarchaeota archaeon CG11_big_fil_rev_8_21_14_0_20_47_5]